LTKKQPQAMFDILGMYAQLENKVTAYAKVNLNLEVLNLRNDGYHNIFSIMAHINLNDLLKLDKFVIKEFSGIEIDIKPMDHIKGSFSNIIEDLPVEKNLIFKAAQKLSVKLNKAFEAKFSICKNIPAGAGLGGGSTDAVAALVLLCGAMDVSLSDIMDLAANIGADVPFALCQGTAICEGIGEQITQLPAILPHFVLLVNDGYHIDTKWAYEKLNRNTEYKVDEAKSFQKKERIQKAFNDKKWNNFFDLCTNDFEENVFKEYPKIASVKEKLAEYGADFSIMTGSGSTMIGLFSDEDKANIVAEKMRNTNKWVYLTKFV